MERDIAMKRHLIEDLKFRQKVNSESSESFSEILENLEKKVSIFMFTDTKILHVVFTFLAQIFNTNLYSQDTHLQLQNYIICSKGYYLS
jgi:hypothetical protein